MQQSKTIRKLGYGLVSLMLALTFALVGCTAQGTPVTEEQSANRQYMSQVNNIMDELQARLDSFDAAVARGDVVTMKTQADNAFKTLDRLSTLDVPDALKEVQDDYVNGTNSLKDALTAQIALYTEIESATSEHPFDYGTYDSRLQEIQDKYDAGISSLQAADEKAASL